MRTTNKIFVTAACVLSLLGVLNIAISATAIIPEKAVLDEFIPMAPQMDVASYVLIDAESRVVLAEHNADGILAGKRQCVEGHCLVSSMQRGGRRLMAVVMGAKSPEARAEHTSTLLDYGFNLYEYRNRQY
jgi:D-alanyl-D-alanine carboxypeptidase